MLPTPEFISTFIEQQFPAFYREEGPNFVAFVKAYYEWMEEIGSQTNKTRNLFGTRDIDLTADAFVEEFKKKYLIGIPKEITGDKRFLQKHILDLYRSKGSNEGLALLFRLLYNEEIKIYIPSVDILKPSDGTWIERKYIEISPSAANYNFDGKIITGSTSGATAFVEKFEKIFSQNRIINIFYISNIQNEFTVGEKLLYDGIDSAEAPFILGSPATADVVVSGSSQNNAVGDFLSPSSGNGTGSGLKLLLSSTKDAGTSNATILFTVVNGGSGFTTDANITITAGSNATGTGAAFTGFTLKNTSSFTYGNNYINYAPYYPITKTFNANTGVSNTVDFISIASNPFANGTLLLYTTDAGNTAVGGLTNNTSYFVITANTSGFRLASNYSSTTATFNALTAVSNTADFITIASNPFANNDLATYTVAAGNTVVVGLANNTSYYVVYANSTGIALANTFGGANINITSTVSETGHTLRLNGRVINLVSGSTQTGHNLFRDQVVRFNANLDVANTTDFISIGNNLFANGDYVTYLVEAGNTAITGLTNNTTYYVVSANTTGLKLATSYGGANINLTAGATQNGHTLKAINVSTLALNSTNFGSSLNNASLSSVIDSAISYYTTTIGTIDKLTGINPGNGYDGYINITVQDPKISGFNIADSNGAILGNNAVINGNVFIGTGLSNTLVIKNSGLGYYTNQEEITVYNTTQDNVYQTTKISINLGAVGSQEGFWSTTKGFLDSNKYIQDSYYYQEYSYEVQSSKSLDKYLSILKQLFHPAGNQPFGKALLLVIDESQEAKIDNPTTFYRILGSELAAGVSFNANTDVSNTADTIIVTNPFNNGDQVRYYTSTGNTTLAALANNSKYYIIGATGSSLQLSIAEGGAAINITSRATETGHYLATFNPISGNLIFSINISRLT